MRKYLFFVFALCLLALGVIGAKNAQATCSALSDAEAQCYLNRYEDLRLAFGANLAAAKAQWLARGCSFEGRHSSCPTPMPLDDTQAQCYLDRYDDLRDAFGTNNLAEAKNHWMGFGGDEGRDSSCNGVPTSAPTPTPISPPTPSSCAYSLTDAQAQCYLNRYADLRAAFGANNLSAAKLHWERHGCPSSSHTEGRSASCPAPSPITDAQAQCYLNRYADLRAAFGANNISAAKRHWLEFGADESRDSSCQGGDPPISCQSSPNAWYLNRHLDVKNSAYGQLANGGQQHFCDYGRNEGRENCFASNICEGPDSTPIPTPSPTPPPLTGEVFLLCQADRMFFSVASYSGKIYAGSYSTMNGGVEQHNAKLYDCTSGANEIRSFNAESVYSLSEYLGALYMSLEGGGGNPDGAGGNPGRAQIYKYSNGNFSQVYSDPSWDLMLGIKVYNSHLYASLNKFNQGTSILKCTGDSCSKLFSGIKSGNAIFYTQFGIHGNALYAGSFGSEAALSKIENDNVSQVASMTGEYSAPVSFKGLMYYNLSNDNSIKIYRYPSTEAVTNISGYSLATWIGVSGDYIYSAVSQAWDAQSGSSALYRSDTGNSGSWEKVADIPMPTIFYGHVDSSGKIYLAGGQKGSYGRVYKIVVTSASPTPTPTPNALTITTASLPAGAVNSPYTAFIEGAGGSSSYTWSITGLPGTLQREDLSTLTGAVAGTQITGTPTEAGTYTVTVTLTSGGQSVTKSFSLVIAP